MTEYCIGIDLGTTNTLCAVWERGANAPRLIPITQPVRSFEPTGFDRLDVLPSVVAVQEDGSVFVGEKARELGRMGRRGVFRSIKREMGLYWTAFAGGHHWTPPRVSACILRAIIQEIAAQYENKPSKVVITVPASFDTDARDDTLAAAGLAGFDLQRTRIFDEPTAALLNQIQAHPSDPLSEGKLMMVDIGGGTLDVSLLENIRTSNGSVSLDILGRSRYTEIAGDDFDQHIAGLLLGIYENHTGHQVEDSASSSVIFFSELLAAAEDGKRRLSHAYHKHHQNTGRRLEKADFESIQEKLFFPATPNGKPWETSLSLAQLGEALRHFFPGWGQGNRTNWLNDGKFFQPIVECLESASLITGKTIEPEDLSAVYLCGGSGYLPMASRAVQQVTKNEPRLVGQPMHAVAMGAAWLAGLLCGYSNALPQIRERLYDGVYLRTRNGRLVELLSPRELIPITSRNIEGQLVMGEMDRRIVVELFVGNAADDPDMRPLARRNVDFGILVASGTPIVLTISVDENRRIQVRFSVDHEGCQLTGNVHVSAEFHSNASDRTSVALPLVNRM